MEPSLNYKECITDHTYFPVRDNYSGAHAHDQKTYAAWDGGSLSIAAGGTAARYLSNAQPNVNAELVLGQNKTLDLCLYNKTVHVIGSSYDQIYLAGGSTLVLSDCTKTGKIIGSKVKSGSGGVAYVKNGTLSVYDIKLTGGSASTGGAVTVDAKGVLNIYSGEISGNTVTSGKGGAIYIKSGGVVNIYGGTIKDNHVYSGDGGAIYVEAGGTLNLYGGEITGNTASGLGGGIYVEAGGRVNIQGAPVVTGNTAGGKANNVYVCADSTSPLLTISGELTDGAKLGVSTDASYPVLLAGSTQDYSAYFTPDDPDAFVLFSGSALTLCAKPSATLEGGTLTVKTGGNYKPDAFVLFVAEYDTDGRLLAVHSEKITPESGTYTFKVQPGAKIKCFLLRTDTYTPLFGGILPQGISTIEKSDGWNSHPPDFILITAPALCEKPEHSFCFVYFKKHKTPPRNCSAAGFTYVQKRPKSPILSGSRRFSGHRKKSTVILSKLRWTYGGVGGIRTLGRLLTVTRFPVVLVMTASNTTP